MNLVSWSCLQRHLTAYSQKQLVLPQMFERVLNNTTSYFDVSYSSPTIFNSPKSIDLIQNTSPLFHKPLLHTKITLRKTKILRTGLEDYRFFQNSRNNAYGRGMGSKKSICDSPLKNPSAQYSK